MTRPFGVQYHCPNCQTWVTAETSFGRWIRNNEKLDSKSGYCVIDQDYWIHKFMSCGDRSFQCILGVEIKTMEANVTKAQQDTLSLVSQLLKDGSIPQDKDIPWKDRRGVSLVTSRLLEKKIYVKSFGIHLLRFAGLGPDDSEWIIWNKEKINTDTLTKIFKFEIDPFTLNPLELTEE